MVAKVSMVPNQILPTRARLTLAARVSQIGSPMITRNFFLTSLNSM